MHEKATAPDGRRHCGDALQERAEIGQTSADHHGEIAALEAEMSVEIAQRDDKLTRTIMVMKLLKGQLPTALRWKVIGTLNDRPTPDSIANATVEGVRAGLVAGEHEVVQALERARTALVPWRRS